MTQQSLPTPLVPGSRARIWLVLRFLLGLALLLAVVVLLVKSARPELERLGVYFVERFGVLGVTLGTVLADGFHFPLPPQFYMLLAIAARVPASTTLVATIGGSLFGGICGYALARQLGKIARLTRFLERVSGRMGQKLGHDYAYRSVLFVSMTPMAFSVLCYLAGLYRMRRGPLLLLLALRIPKLALYYYLVQLGWSAP